MALGVSPSLRSLPQGPEAGDEIRRAASRGRPIDGEEDSETIDARIADYLRRHGEKSRIDPEGQRRRIAAEYDRYRKEAAARRLSPLAIGGTEWISLGPTNGAGRMTAIAPVFGGLAYAGAAGGGVWKTTDGGTTWAPLTEGIHDLSVGAVAVAPSNPSILYVGTGEGGYGGSFIPGIGFLKSTDGGATWILPPAVLATSFYRVLVHPTDANELVAGTNAGAFRSTDGGATWTNVISYQDYGDIPDMVRDATDPKTLYATTWCVTRNCTFKSARVLRSTDGGATWSDRSNGLPTPPPSGRNERTSIAISVSRPQVLYAARAIRDLVVTGELICHVYKTTDAGATWADLSSLSSDPELSRYMGSQAYYDNTIAVSPTDPNVVVAGGVDYVRSTDGGSTFSAALGPGGGGIHSDCHDLRYEGARLWIANDGGIFTSDDDGKTGNAKNSGLVTRQFYALANDPVHHDRILAGSQDNGTSQRLAGGTEWRSIAGADGIQCAVNPASPETGWITIQGGTIFRMQNASSDSPLFEDVTPPFDPDEFAPFRTIVQPDPRAPGTLLTGSNRVWRSRDGGGTWRPLPTVTTDGTTWSPDDTLVDVTVPAVDSPMVLVAKGHAVFRSGDRGETWVAGRGLPDFAVNDVEIDPRDPLTAYACLATTSGASVFRSGDGGLTWTAASNGLPSFAAQVLRVDPTDSADLFCGTDVGVFRSSDRGATWARFGTGLPAASIHDVRIFEDGSVLRAATYGRGVWELRAPASGNSPPTAAISAPAGPVSLATGASFGFAGVVSDSDPGDTATGTWYFPDDGSLVPMPAAGAVVRHTFRTAGIFSVALAAKDRRGARASATVLVEVQEIADSCASPAVIPGSGPFPYTLSWNDQGGTSEPTDPDAPCYPGRGRSGSTWFEFTPSASGTYTFSTCTPVSTAISIFTGDACGPYAPVTTACGSIGGGSDCGFGVTSTSAALTGGRLHRILLGGVTDGDVGPVALTVGLGTPPDGTPRIQRVTDAFGPTSGGTDVVITGNDFAEGSAVSFGGSPATDIHVLAMRVLAARTPPHRSGPVDVAVTAPGGGAATLGKGFLYVAAPSPCVASATVLCLNDGRFRVTADWRVDAQNQSGQAAAVPLTRDTGYFWFFSANNIELVVKVVDGRAVNGRFWIFYGALSNIEYRITVTDSTTGEIKVYTNPSGALASVADTAAF